MKVFAAVVTAILLAGSAMAAGGPFGGSSPVDPRHLYLNKLERQFAEIEATAPGFGGWYFDRDGNAVVRMKENGRGVDAVARVEQIIHAQGPAGRGRVPRPSIGTRPALYSFSELAGFRHAFTENFPAGVFSVDIDEVNNVLAIGVADRNAAQVVRTTTARLQIPGAALRIEIEAPPEGRTSLWDHQRPIRGGIGFTSQTGDCAVGMNAKSIYNNGNDVGFFSAAHCSHTTWAWDGAYVYQPNVLSSYFIGYEWDDPTPTTNVTGCPVPGPNNSYDPDLACRYSDAAFFMYDASQRATLNGYNTIASTTSWSYAAPGSTTVSGSMTVLGEVWAPPVGVVIDKIGPYSGWTYGTITQTCELLLSPDRQPGPDKDPVYLPCQDVTDIYSVYGDSGSPVFKWTQNGVYWVGLLWGGPRGNPKRSYHSSNDNIWYDFPTYTYYWY